MQIRSYEQSDFAFCKQILQEIHNLHEENRPDIYHKVDLSDEFVKDMFSDINLVAVENGQVVGILIASIKHTLENEMMKSIDMIWVEGIGVSKKFQKKGIGTELFHELEKIAKEKGISKIELNVWNFNQGALKFYQKLGFKIKSMRLEKEKK